jgi:small-conductance mechanosensitive channel
MTNAARELLAPGITLGLTLLGMALVQLLWQRVLSPILQRLDLTPDETLLAPLRALLFWGLGLTGFYHALGDLPWLQQHEKFSRLLDRASGVLWVLLVLWTLQRMLLVTLHWYVERAGENPDAHNAALAQATLVRKIVRALLAGIGIVYILRAAGADISPLLASGAIGGLAVALAAQDTLSNLFAGFYLTLDRPIRVGDFIRLETGQEGFVEAIGWRNTRLRQMVNNLVVIPNAKLSQSVITNYYLPETAMSLSIPCGVAYNSDLHRVEAVCIEVARQLQQSLEGADPEWEPVVRWKEFGDFAVTFVTVLRVKEYSGQFALQSEFVKQLHTRFQQEGIEIPFPTRSLVWKSAPPPSAEAASENAPAEPASPQPPS